MKTTKEMVKLLQQSSNGTTEEDLRTWAESIIEECAITADESCEDNPEQAGGRIRDIKQQL